jgi:hypothetical protein
MRRTLSTPPASVVMLRKHNGKNVTSAYCRFGASRSTMVVPTQSAVQASNWLATPNIGQIVEMLPVRMK